MLDEKGRLFGKINIVDALIVIVLLAAVAFVGIKYVMPSNDTAVDEQSIELVVYAKDTVRSATDELNAGDVVWDATGKATLGNLKSWTTDDYFEPIADGSSGVIVMYKDPTRCVAHLTIDAKGSIGDYGATINGVLYGIGHTMVIYSGVSKLYVSVAAINSK